MSIIVAFIKLTASILLAGALGSLLTFICVFLVEPNVQVYFEVQGFKSGLTIFLLMPALVAISFLAPLLSLMKILKVHSWWWYAVAGGLTGYFLKDHMEGYEWVMLTLILSTSIAFWFLEIRSSIKYQK